MGRNGKCARAATPSPLILGVAPPLACARLAPAVTPPATAGPSAEGDGEAQDCAHLSALRRHCHGCRGGTTLARQL